MFPRDLPGTPYRLLRPLGQGGMGQVFEAEHVGLARRVALKMLSEGLGGDPAAADRMRLEAQALAKVSHPGIVSVFDVGVSAEGAVFVAMELVRGETLSARSRRERLPTREALDIVRRVAEALHAAHLAGFVHRDVKPANIVLGDDGSVKLLDFGIAKLTRADAGVAPLARPTAEGVPIGTPHYFAPEQALGERVDARSDVYACGAMLWLLLTGRRLFSEATDLGALVLAHCRAPAPPPSAHGLRAPADLAPRIDAVVLKALEKRPSDRYESASELASALQALLGAPLGAPPALAPPALAPPALAPPALAPPSAPRGAAQAPAGSARTVVVGAAKRRELSLWALVLLVCVGSALLALFTIFITERLGR